MSRPIYDRPTDAEIQILAILWKHGWRTVRQVFIELTKLRGSGYNSALKLMQIMHAKGLLTRDDSVRPQRYRAVSSRVGVQRRMLKDLITRVFDGDANALRQMLGAPSCDSAPTCVATKSKNAEAPGSSAAGDAPLAGSPTATARSTRRR